MRALSHVARALLGALDDEVEVRRGHAAVLQQVQQGEDARRLPGQVLHQDVGRQAGVRGVSAADAADDLATEVQGQGLTILDLRFDVGQVLHVFGPHHALDDRLRDDGVLRQLGADGLRKTLLQPDELELVAGGDQPQELVLRHDLAELAVALCVAQAVLGPGGLGLLERLVAQAADVGLVGSIVQGLLVGLKVLGQSFDVLLLLAAVAGFVGGAAVVAPRLGRVVQTIGIALDSYRGHP